MPTPPGFTGLVLPSAREVAELNAALPVCDSFTLADLDDWESLLTPENDPSTFLKWDKQQRNDCQAHALTTGLELIHYRTSTALKGVPLSRSFAYNTCEQLSGFRLGGDVGTTIQSGVKLASEIGVPDEAHYPYSQYTRDQNQLARWRSAVEDSLPASRIAKATPAPPWDTAIAATALGHPIHMGFFWPLIRTAGTVNGKKYFDHYQRNHGTGGHAVLGAFPIKLDSGQIVLMIGNSHGDEYFVVSEDFYEEARSTSPYGMYQLYGHENPVQAYYDGRRGLFSGRVT